MSRYAGFSLALIAVSAMAGCRGSKPEPPQPVVAGETTTATAVAEAPSETPKPSAGDNAPNEAGAPSAETQAEGAPSVLGAISRAVSGTMGISDDAEPSEAPAYRPPQ